MLEARGLAVSVAERETILRCGDVTTLDRWIRLAVTIHATDELFR